MKLQAFFLSLIVASLSSPPARADSPRERVLMDFNWRFHPGEAPDAGNKFDYPEVKDLSKTHVDEIGLEGEPADLLYKNDLGSDISFVQTNFNDRDWRKLDLPHDWVVELPFDEQADRSHGYKPVGPAYPQNSIGWYRRAFDLPAADKGKTLQLEFDGVYRNSLVWLNGHFLGRHLSGYSSFRYDISKIANYGGRNTLVVRVDASRFEGWFYEGAGIYRHVWLEKTSPFAIDRDGLFVWSSFSNNVPEGPAQIHIDATLENQTSAASPMAITYEIISPEGKTIVKRNDDLAYAVTAARWLEQAHDAYIRTNIVIQSPELWSPESPKLYKLITTVQSGGKTVDRVETEFGIRTIAFDTEKGFLLNGKPYTVKGTCNHQDHAGVGAALPDALQYYRIKKLKEMGSNAYRTSHNPPTPELLEACDRLGMLVMDETRRMDTNRYALDELSSLILRDRNHPSIFIWSLGNEEFYLQGTKTNAGISVDMAHDAAVKIATAMQDFAHQMDPTRQCTIAMNGGWGNGFSMVVDVQGFNYHTAGIDAYHAKFPTQPEIGTEVASTRTTRGIYTDDKKAGYVAAYGSNGVERAQQWWPYYATHPFTSGGFVWTGFDYRGEPTPYKWPCINSHFGLMDMCGFPKDLYYYYKSWWTDRPVLHILPHWNWPQASATTNAAAAAIPVRVFSNCKEVELFLNGKSLGKQTMSANGLLNWDVAYEPGALTARGYDGDRLVTESKVETTGAPAAIVLSPDRTAIHADAQDVSVVDVMAVDAKGRVVPTADDVIEFDLDGPGRIIGVGNGDPSSHEPDKAHQRRLFCGYAQVIVQSENKSGTLKLTAVSGNLKKDTVKISSETVTSRPATP
jgi:beta-galactosidase